VSLSRDGKRVAFLVQQADKLVVYHDFRPIAEYPPHANVFWPLTLSADGSRVAWRVDRTVYLDGVPQPITGVGRLPVLSDDGRTLAYVADDTVVVNGVRGPPYANIRSLGLSDDGSVVAYLGEDDDGDWIVAGPRRIPTTSDVRDLALSPDGRRLAWITRQRVVVDGRPGPPFEEVERPVFSPDGLGVAYVAKRDGRRVVVVNDREMEVDGHLEQLHFSPDGRRLGMLVTVDRREIRWKVIPAP
jgi:WD40 repeat protein